jgi:hypothetical protein
MSCRPSVHPAITPFRGNSAGSPRCIELSNIVPSMSINNKPAEVFGQRLGKFERLVPIENQHGAKNYCDDKYQVCTFWLIGFDQIANRQKCNDRKHN